MGNLMLILMIGSWGIFLVALTFKVVSFFYNLCEKNRIEKAEQELLHIRRQRAYKEMVDKRKFLTALRKEIPPSTYRKTDND